MPLKDPSLFGLTIPMIETGTVWPAGRGTVRSLKYVVVPMAEAEYTCLPTLSLMSLMTLEGAKLEVRTPMVRPRRLADIVWEVKS